MCKQTLDRLLAKAVLFFTVIFAVGVVLAVVTLGGEG